MRSRITSYAGLFAPAPDATPITRVEIPIYQRDYAQGRHGAAAQRIRQNFLKALHRAVTRAEPITLDFVYGDVAAGVLRPLDGQQRLTTLFLLHWYLAMRAGTLDPSAGLWNFSYATRAGARLFCQRLVAARPVLSAASLQHELRDLHWFLPGWDQDPTISAMLVMLDDIHGMFDAADHRAAWASLVDPRQPAVVFHLLAESLGPSEQLYIKMNSRGKPLTEFENFKAQLEKAVGEACPDRIQVLAQRVDGAWTDVFWPYRGADQLVDDEFLRFFSFVTDLTWWRQGRLPSGDLLDRATAVFGREADDPGANVEFLSAAFEAWTGQDLAVLFGDLFAVEPVGPAGGVPRVRLFGRLAALGSDLFAACCGHYEPGGRSRQFTAQHALVLYAVMVHRMHATADVHERLRVLRNVLEASENELRAEAMPTLAVAVESFIRTGELSTLRGFNASQVAEERDKQAFVAAHPEHRADLQALEDMDLLRGSLAAFELDPGKFRQRARMFRQLMEDPADWDRAQCGLHLMGDSARRPNQRMFQFGSRHNPAPWRALLTGNAAGGLPQLRAALSLLLDALAPAGEDWRDALGRMQAEWLDAAEREQRLDWRYYLVKYPEMRDGRSGLYAGRDGSLGYELCMLDKTIMSSNYRDPFLCAMHQASGGEQVRVETLKFTGYEDRPRYLRLSGSGVGLRSVAAGIEVHLPEGADEHAWSSPPWLRRQQTGPGRWLVPVAQTLEAERGVDREDRVRLGADLLRSFAASA